MPAQRAPCEGEAYEIEFLEVPNLVYRTLGGGFLRRGTHTPTRHTIFGGHMVEEGSVSDLLGYLQNYACICIRCPGERSERN